MFLYIVFIFFWEKIFEVFVLKGFRRYSGCFFCDKIFVDFYSLEIEFFVIWYIVFGLIIFKVFFRGKMWFYVVLERLVAFCINVFLGRY